MDRSSLDLCSELFRKVALLMEECDLDECKIEVDNVKFRASRRVYAACEYNQENKDNTAVNGDYSRHFSSFSDHSSSSNTCTKPLIVKTKSGNDANLADSERIAQDNDGCILKSPMVGTVYLAKSPEAEPFTKVGANIKEGDTVLIVEAMKTMNYVSAHKSGVVKKFFVENGDPVEYKESLVLIE